MIRRALAAIGVVLVLVSAAGAFGPGRFGLMPTEGPVAVVTGAIVPCARTGTHPANAGGTVYVRGPYAPNDIDPGFGAPNVFQQKVEPNGVYTFVLDPGLYELSSGYAFTGVDLKAGDDVRADLRQPCL